MITYTAKPGDSIRRTIEEALGLAKKHKTEVAFEFNQKALVVSPESYGKDVLTIYNLMSECSALRMELASVNK